MVVARVSVAEHDERFEAGLAEQLRQFVLVEQALVQLAEPPGLLVFGIAVRVAVHVVEVEHWSQRAGRLLEIELRDVPEIRHADVAARASRLQRFADSLQVRQSLRAIQMLEERVAEGERDG